MIRSVVLTSLVLVLAAADASAQDNASSSSGFVNAKYAGEFLGSGVGGRSAGLGGAGTGIANDVTAGYFNPAALSQVNYVQASILHESRFAGQINYDYAGVALPLGANQTFALSAIRVGLDGIKDTRNALNDLNGNGQIDEDERLDETKIKTGGAADWAFIGSYARKVNDQLSWGGNVKVLHKSVLEHSAWGLGVDVSAMYRPMENMQLGATLTDATKSLLSWDTGNQEFIVPTLKLGGAYKLQVLEDHSIMPALDAILRFEGRHETTMLDLGFTSLDLQGGLEYSYKDRVFVRGGATELGQYTVGAGVKLPKLNIDYAFISQGPDQDALGATHRISLMLTLEEEKFAR